jgi:hypothetical protein
MAVKGKREPKPQAGPGALVDLNLWDVLVGLMEPAETPEAPAHEPRPSEAGPAAAGEAERAEAGEKVRAARRRTDRKPRRETKRRGEADSKV